MYIFQKLYRSPILSYVFKYGFADQNTQKVVNYPQKQLKNSIAPIQNNVAFGYYFPKEWKEEDILTRLDPARTAIKSIKILRNKLGQHTGRIMFTFMNTKFMNNYIKKYNQDFINTGDGVQKIVIRPFELHVNKTQQNPIKTGVRISNLDFQLTEKEIRKLAQDFGKVLDVEIPLRPNGLNKGFAIVYFDNGTSRRQFYEFADQLLFLGRKIRVTLLAPQKYQQKNSQHSQIQIPKLTIQQNQKLYENILKKKSEKIA